MNRSTFVVVFAALTLVGCALGLLTGTLLVVMISSVGGSDQIPVVGQHTGASLLLFRHLEVFLSAVLAYCALGCVASIGLLVGTRRWPRTVWIVLLVIAMAWAVLVVSIEIAIPDPEPARVAPGFLPPTGDIALLSVLLYAAVVVGFATFSIFKLRKRSS